MTGGIRGSQPKANSLAPLVPLGHLLPSFALSLWQTWEPGWGRGVIRPRVLHGWEFVTEGPLPGSAPALAAELSGHRCGTGRSPVLDPGSLVLSPLLGISQVAFSLLVSYSLKVACRKGAETQSLDHVPVHIAHFLTTTY